MGKLYPWLRPNMIAKFRARVGNTRRYDEVVKSSEEVRSKRQPVHGRMIQRWARQQVQALEIEDFKASDGWLTKFKRRHRIVSRKVTLYRGRAEIASDAETLQNVISFKSNYSKESTPFDHAQIWNYDQTGFNYEPANLRTLRFRGERDTILMVDSKNKRTHCYTVQPLISRNGDLFEKVLIVLQETGGSFGPQIGPHVAELERK